MKMINLKNKRGITLIALVITIIVLLILAGVALSLVLGENGITERAVKAGKTQNISGAKEKLELDVANYGAEFYQAKYVNGKLPDNVDTIQEYIMSKFPAKDPNYADGSYTLEKIADDKLKLTENFDHTTTTTATINGDGKVLWDAIDYGDGSTSGGNDTPVATSTQWEIVTDSGTTGLTIGDLVRPTVTGVTSEQFFVIGKDDTAGTVTLLAEKCVKTTSGTGQYTTQVGSGSADILAFRADSSASNANVYSASDIKVRVETYANNLAGYLTLEDVETAEGGDPVSGVKGRLMWGTSSSGEVKALLDAGLTDLVYGASTARLNYWLGTSNASNTSNAWGVNGNGSYLIHNDVGGGDSFYGLRPVIKVLQSKF